MKKLYNEKILPAKIAAMDREDLAELAEGNPLHIRALCSLRTNSEEATDDTLCMPEEDVVYGSVIKKHVNIFLKTVLTFLYSTIPAARHWLQGKC